MGGWQTLVRLGALRDDDESITPLGRLMSAFPIAPRFAKMLVLGHQVTPLCLATRSRPCAWPTGHAPRYPCLDTTSRRPSSGPRYSCLDTTSRYPCLDTMSRYPCLDTPRYPTNPVSYLPCRTCLVPNADYSSLPLQGGCLPYVVSLVAALSVENPIVCDKADAPTRDCRMSDGDEEEDDDPDLNFDLDHNKVAFFITLPFDPRFRFFAPPIRLTTTWPHLHFAPICSPMHPTDRALSPGYLVHWLLVAWVPHPLFLSLRRLVY